MGYLHKTGVSLVGVTVCTAYAVRSKCMKRVAVFALLLLAVIIIILALRASLPRQPVTIQTGDAPTPFVTGAPVYPTPTIAITATPIPFFAATQASPRTHIVKAGDTFLSIGRKYGCAVKDLEAANTHLASRKSPSGKLQGYGYIVVGEPIVIPSTCTAGTEPVGRG